MQKTLESDYTHICDGKANKVTHLMIFVRVLMSAFMLLRRYGLHFRSLSSRGLWIEIISIASISGLVLAPDQYYNDKFDTFYSLTSV